MFSEVAAASFLIAKGVPTTEGAKVCHKYDLHTFAKSGAHEWFLENVGKGIL